MIIEYNRIDLFGKLLFEKAIIRPPLRKPNPMVNEACFLHVREGVYQSISDNDLLPVPKGQSVLMRCGNYLSRMLPDERTGLYQAVAVHFHPDVLRRIYATGLPAFLTKGRKVSSASQALVEASVPIEKYIEDILFYFDHPALVNDDILSLKTKEIILLLMQTEEAPQVRAILENLFSPRTLDFTAIIEAHLFHPLTLAELAMLTNMSLSSFKRKFKTVYQDNPSSYIQQKRLEKARELLCFSDHSVGDIADQCGYKTISHFSKRFKDFYGQAPLDYRLNQIGK